MRMAKKSSLYRPPLSKIPEFRKKFGKRHYPDGLVDRGLVRPAVTQLARIWETDYETAHRIILSQRQQPVRAAVRQ
jgi:hypothetical protein